MWSIFFFNLISWVSLKKTRHEWQYTIDVYDYESIASWYLRVLQVSFCPLSKLRSKRDALTDDHQFMWIILNTFKNNFYVVCKCSLQSFPRLRGNSIYTIRRSIYKILFVNIELKKLSPSISQLKKESISSHFFFLVKNEFH